MNYFKKATTLVALTFFGLTSLQAQDDNSEVGIKGGVNFSNFYSDEVDDQDLRIGFQGGLFFKAGITDFFAIQPEVLFTQKGATTKYDNFATGEAEFTNKLNYLEIPVMGVINITDNFNVHAGPYFAYLLSASVENEAENDDFNFAEDLNEGDFERVDYGVGIGAGFEFETLRFGARYNYGLTEIGKEQSFSFDGSEQTSDEMKDLKNATFSLFLGLSF